tara:strand:+ start:8 stop:4753 length:4746 start_codon:yes stop_codon:yes gene_type:complete
MNKDLDERLVPNGEYRDAINIQVSQSESSDIGTLSVSLGNTEISDFGLSSNCGARIIGLYTDEKEIYIYVFITNFIDTSGATNSSYPPSSVINQIWRRNIETNENTKLVEGRFLNFSLNNFILNIDLIEDLLFWTDNRNQPRKINVKKANPARSDSPTYYTTEDHISVAKYAPFESISLMKDYLVNFTLTNRGGATGSYYNLIGQTLSTSVTSTVGENEGQGMTVLITDAAQISGNIISCEIVNEGSGYSNGDVIQIGPAKAGGGEITLSIENQSTMKNKCDEFLPEVSTFGISSINNFTTLYNSNVVGSTDSIQCNSISTPFTGTLTDIDGVYNNCFIKVISNGADVTPYNAVVDTLVYDTNYSAYFLRVRWPAFQNNIVLNPDYVITIGVNPDYDAEWPGDCEYLKDKFIRFAYRFKFDDNEYSLISPFTQACFIPKNNGYFLKETVVSTDAAGSNISIDNYDSNTAFESTENEKFENSINNIDLEIPCPIFLNGVLNNWSNIEKELHVTSVEIIYKNDSEDVLKVLDTIDLSEFGNLNQTFLNYSYQSTVPIKTLPEEELIRVSDKVPLKSLTQSVSGNRVIYGNYVDGHSSNLALNYQVASAKKLSVNTPTFSTLKKEYQNHTLKQNRTYQVGVVLSDRYGRQSDVILSTLDTSISGFGSSIEFGGSTLRNDYYKSNPGLIQPGGTGVLASTWPGDSLIVQFNAQLPSENGIPGYPGLFIDYNDPFVSNFYGGLNYPSFPINLGVANTNVATTTTGSGAGLTIDYFTIPQPSASTSQIFSITINTPGFGYKSGDVVTISHPGGIPPSNFANASFVYNSNINPNLTGWFSYRIVVKQQEQDYYNVYLPGIVNGSLGTEGYLSSKEATLSLYNDNINKIPKDLTDVGPSQTSFSTSDSVLFLRVQNEKNNNTSSRQFYPKNNESETVVSLSELSDLGFNLKRFSSICVAAMSGVKAANLTDFNPNVYRGMSVVISDKDGNNIYGIEAGLYIRAYSSLSTGAVLILNKAITILSSQTPAIFSLGPPGVVYNSGSNPVISSLSTSSIIGVSEEQDFIAQLAVFETEPVKSELDIFFETSSTGLISELNNAVAEGSVAGESVANISAIEILQSTFNEGATGSYNIINNSFFALDFQNTALPSSRADNSIASLISVLDDNGADRSSEFEIVDNNNGSFNIKTTKPPGNGYYISNNRPTTTFNFTVKLTNDGTSLFKTFQGEVGNLFPIYGNSNLPGGTGDYGGVYNPIPFNPHLPAGYFTYQFQGQPMIGFMGTYPYVFGPGVFNSDRPNERGYPRYPYKQLPPGQGLGPTNRAEYTPVPFTCTNGSGDTNLNKRDITWEVVSWITADATPKVLDSNLPIPFFSEHYGQPQVFPWQPWMNLPTDVVVGSVGETPPARTNGYQIIIGEDTAASKLYGGLLNPDVLKFVIPDFDVKIPSSAPANNTYNAYPLVSQGPLYSALSNVNESRNPNAAPIEWTRNFTSSSYSQSLNHHECLIGVNNNFNEITTDWYITQGGSSGFFGIGATSGTTTQVDSIPIFALVENIKFKVTLQAKDGDNLVAAPFTVEFDIVGQQGYTVRNQRVI